MLTEHHRLKPYNEINQQTKLIKSSTPIKRSIDPISTNLSQPHFTNGISGGTSDSRDNFINNNDRNHNRSHWSSRSCCSSTNTMNLEKIYPGIYLTSVKSLCSTECLKLFGFTHIIYIDKHIIADDDSITTGHRDHQHHSKTTSERNAATTTTTSIAASTLHPHHHSSNQSPTRTHHGVPPVRTDNSHVTDASQRVDKTTTKHVTTSRATHKNENLFGHSEFETLDLNFGESSYLTTVLPNCYKAVKFIETALKHNGAVLVIDCIGENQKCLTIVVGFLMYKYNKNFLTAYQLIKRFHPNIELDRFFITQLYEYEPILQVQRTQSGGNSCSRELRSALLKRKKSNDDFYYHPDTLMPTILPSAYVCNSDAFISNIEQSDILME